VSEALAERAPFAFMPRKGETEWWRGDPLLLPMQQMQDSDGLIIVRRRVLSPPQCRTLVDCFERNRKTCTTKDCAPYWAGRYIWQDRLPPTETDALRLMQQVRFLAQLLLIRHAQPGRFIYSDTAQLVRWPEGVELTAHTDNMEPDGAPNSTPHRCYSSLMYLNEDYDGGETFFPGFNVRLKPEAGTLILFGAGPQFVHGVTRVTRGLRYTYAGWFTFQQALEDRNASLIF
jgi:hypothetical protein